LRNNLGQVVHTYVPLSLCHKQYNLVLVGLYKDQNIVFIIFTRYY